MRVPSYLRAPIHHQADPVSETILGPGANDEGSSGRTRKTLAACGIGLVEYFAFIGRTTKLRLPTALEDEVNGSLNNHFAVGDTLELVRIGRLRR